MHRPEPAECHIYLEEQLPLSIDQGSQVETKDHRDTESFPTGEAQFECDWQQQQ